MYRYFVAAVVAAGLLSAGHIARAQAPAPAQDATQPITIVVYTEVAPAKAADAKKLILGGNIRRLLQPVLKAKGLAA